MAAGFAMLEGGLVRSKNVTMQMTKNVALFSLAAIMYWLIGYNLMYPLGDWAIEGYFSGLFPSWGVLEPVYLNDMGLEAADDAGYASTGSDFFFQLMFCAATASIVSGALAERIKLWPFLIFTVVLTGFIYPLTASWQWGGGWLSEAGFSDFAGSTVVHACGAAAALAGAIVLGPRLGKYKDGKVNPMPGSNLALATLGMFILWLGWFGFNGGSQLAMGSAADIADVSRIFSNTNMAAAAGAVAALILTQVMYGKADLTMVLNGALAGLVSITAEPLAPSLGLALIIGAIGGLIVVLTVPMLDKMKIDDVVGAIPVTWFRGHLGHARRGPDRRLPRRSRARHAGPRHRGYRRRDLRDVADRLVHPEGRHGHPGLRRSGTRRPRRRRAWDGSLPGLHQGLSRTLAPRAGSSLPVREKSRGAPHGRPFFVGTSGESTVREKQSDCRFR
jgi:Amt family ammonium transporter